MPWYLRIIQDRTVLLTVMRPMMVYVRYVIHRQTITRLMEMHLADRATMTVWTAGHVIVILADSRILM